MPKRVRVSVQNLTQAVYLTCPIARRPGPAGSPRVAVRPGRLLPLALACGGNVTRGQEVSGSTVFTQCERTERPEQMESEIQISRKSRSQKSRFPRISISAP